MTDKPFPEAYLDEIMPRGETEVAFAVTKLTRHEGTLRVFRIERKDRIGQLAGVWMDLPTDGLSEMPHYGRTIIQESDVLARFPTRQRAEAVVKIMEHSWKTSGGVVDAAREALRRIENHRKSDWLARTILFSRLAGGDVKLGSEPEYVVVERSELEALRASAKVRP